MTKFESIKMGATGEDTVTGVVGKITAKVERLTGDHQVLLETVDSTGRPIAEWVQLERLTVK